MLSGARTPIPPSLPRSAPLAVALDPPALVVPTDSEVPNEHEKKHDLPGKLRIFLVVFGVNGEVR